MLMVPDESHRTWNDAKQALTDASWWQLVLLHALCMNLDYCPFEGAAFWLKMKATKSKLVERLGQASALLLAFVPRKLQDLHWLHRADEADIESAAWEAFAGAECFLKKATRTSPARWFAYASSVEEFDTAWHCRCLALLF